MECLGGKDKSVIGMILNPIDLIHCPYSRNVSFPKRPLADGSR